MTSTLTAPETEVAGYPNYRLANFWMWLDNDQQWRNREIAFYDRPALSLKRGQTWTDGYWAKFYSFYTTAVLMYERQYVEDKEDKLTLADKSTFLRESADRFRTWENELRLAREAEFKRTYQPAPFPLLPEPVMTEQRPFWHTPYRDYVHPTVMLGPSPNLQVPSAELLSGEAKLIVLQRGEVVEIKPGDYVQSIDWFGDVWSKVKTVWKSDGSDATIIAEGRRKNDEWIHETVGQFYKIRAVSTVLPPYGRLYGQK